MADIESIITRLLHIEEESTNKLIDLNASEGTTFLLGKADDGAGDLAESVFEVVKERIGKTATTALTGSALTEEETFAAPGYNAFTYRETMGERDPKRLDRFYREAKRLTTAKGDNPVFLSVGALKFKIPNGKELKEIESPLLIVPIRLVRSGGPVQPITVEFTDDDVIFNPAFYAKLGRSANARFVKEFPLPSEDLKTPIDLERFRVKDYFDRLEEYLSNSVPAGETPPYVLERETVAISMYNNPDISMYRDILRNKQRILKHPVVRAMFFKEDAPRKKTETEPIEPPFVLPYDGRQKRIIGRVLAGENLVVKGPPGTGKTQTIANLVAALLADGKRVLFSSKKISALAEVYNKLPDDLKPYLLRLDYESEAETAKIDARVVHGALKDAYLAQPKEKESGVLARRAEAYDRKFGAIERLRRYKNKMFGRDRSSEDFYSALIGYMRHFDLEPQRFELPGKILQTSTEEFLSASDTVKKIAESYDRLTDGNKIPIRLNPWYSLKPEAGLKEGTFTAAEALKSEAEDLLNGFREFAENNPEVAEIIGNFRLDVVRRIAECPLSVPEAEEILRKKNLSKIAGNTKKLAVDVRVAKDRIGGAIKKNTRVFEIDLSLLKGISDLKTASNLDLRLLKRLSESKEIYNDRNGVLSDEIELPILLNALRMYSTSISEARNTVRSAASVFDEAVFSDRNANKALTDAYDALKKYIGKGETGVKPLDFASKRALKSARRQMRNPDYVDFNDALTALQRVQNYNRYMNQAAKFMDKAQNLLHIPLKEQEATDLLRLLEAFYNENKEDFREEMRCIERELPIIEQAKNALNIGEDSEFTVGDLKELYRAAKFKKKLEEDWAELKKSVPCLIKSDDYKYYELMGEAVEALDYMSEAAIKFIPEAEKGGEEHVDAVVRFGTSVKSVAKKRIFTEFLDRFTSFFRKNFSDSAYANPAKVRLNDLETFARFAGDRSYLAAATNIRLLMESEKKLNVTAFFRPYLQGEKSLKTGENFLDLFVHSFYAARVDAVKATFGESVYSLTRDNLAMDLKTLAEAEKDLLRLNAKRTAFLCSSRFDPGDKAFDFLKTNTSYTACRRLFQEHAEEILKLKQCLILSPSSVSLLLRSEEYFGFDVAIIDEASQMPPENVIGIAARAKQCVVVGDENQMPPIRHFVRQNADGAEEGLVAVESAMELLKQNGSFAVEELTGHYRSRTESLIRYSQRRFYPEMVTFPSVLPRGEALGLFDVFVDGASSSGGVNEKEAEAVVKLIGKHFDRFFDEKTETLARSLGIVTFGIAQSEYVEKLARENRPLYAKIRAAEEHAEVPEKAFFIRNIETVQGQETDCLILSVTYGRDKNGRRYENFGQLNGTLGERIFNVAVTRARYSVTLIHSIRASELQSEGLRYLRDYMEEVERFDRDDARTQFLSHGEPDPFRRSVRDTLIKAGIPENRIVFDYGVTDNSVRIPVAILSENKKSAACGLWLETEPYPDPLDGALRYPAILKERGWNLYEIYAFDWVRNHAAEAKRLAAYVKKHISPAKE